MAEFQCKYCGVSLGGSKRQMCCHCYEKLPLVRQLQGMVRDAKEKAVREQCEFASVFPSKCNKCDHLKVTQTSMCDASFECEKLGIECDTELPVLRYKNVRKGESK